jgi:hypothetical protein
VIAHDLGRAGVAAVDALDISEPSNDEVLAVSRGIASAVSSGTGLSDTQVALLNALTLALTDTDVDYASLEPIEPDALATVLERRGIEYRQRIVHHMVLGEMALTPIPPEVAANVQTFARALGVDDDFVRIARRYADGAFGLAWNDLRRSGFEEHWDDSHMTALHTRARLADPFDEPTVDPELAERWERLGSLPPDTLGRAVFDMYRARGFYFPGAPGGASAYLAQHDFVHVVADYGTNLEGEIEAFSFMGRADPDPKGFAWIATVVGLFDTGYVPQQGFFQADVRDRHARTPGMNVRLADALKRGKAVAENFGVDLFRVDFHELAPLPLGEVRERLRVPPKSPEALAAGSVSVTDPKGMTDIQREWAAQLDQAPGS